jgi:predicted transcriptional regulator of viral defense system
MDINELHRNRVIGLTQKENGMVWLVEHGPLVASPPLPAQILSSLVETKRIMRLRRDLYLAPGAGARLPSLYEAINLVDPDGYISGQGALMLHGLTDQDVPDWYSVTSKRQGDITYGVFPVHFVFSPDQARTAARTTVGFEGRRVVVGTVAQAIVDEALLMPLGLDYGAVARALRIAFLGQKTSEAELVAALRARGSVAAARRLGFLTEIVTSRVNDEMMAMAMGNDGATKTTRDSVHEPKWRLYLPDTRRSILSGSR